MSQLSEREKNHKNLDESDDDEYAEEEEHTGDESSPASRPGKRRHFDETLIQQRMEEDRERVSALVKCNPLMVSAGLMGGGVGFVDAVCGLGISGFWIGLGCGELRKWEKE